MPAHIKKIVLALCVLAVLIIVALSGLRNHVTLESIQEKSYFLQQMVAKHYLRSVVAFIGAYITAVILVLPVSLLTMTGGFLFGTVAGALYTNIGATIGATLFFMMVRYFLGDWLQKKYASSLATFNKALKDGGVSYLIVVHFIAFVPFSLVNTLAGLTQVPLGTFVWTTSVGILPASLVYSFAGRQLRSIKTLSDIFSYNVLAALLLLGVIALLPFVIKWFTAYRRARV